MSRIVTLIGGPCDGEQVETEANEHRVYEARSGRIFINCAPAIAPKTGLYSANPHTGDRFFWRGWQPL